MLRLYAIVRSDLGMSPGKIASQAGHAYLGAFTEASKQTPAEAALYAADPPGTKICLQASTEQLYRVREQLQHAGIPHFVVIDSGCENFYGGQPILTAIGCGPLTKEEAPKVLRRLELL